MANPIFELKKRARAPVFQQGSPTQNEVHVAWPSPSQNLGIVTDDEKILQIPSIEKWAYLPNKDPFILTYHEFLRLALDEVKNMYNIVYGIFKNSLEEKWKEGYRHAVICNREYSYLSKDIEDVKNIIIKKLSIKEDKACYVFSAPDVVEETPWTPAADPHYPTLGVYLGLEEMEDEEIIETTEIIRADLDTGNPLYKIFDVNIIDKRLRHFDNLELGQATHLKKNSRFIEKNTK